MNKLLLLFFIFLSLASFSQTTKIKVKKEKEEKGKPVKPTFYHHISLDLYYGNRVFAKTYYDQVNTIDHINLKRPLTFAGIGISGYEAHINRSGRVLTQMNYYKIIPDRVAIEDTISTKISGFVFGYGLGFSIATTKKKLSLSTYFGFNTGRTTLSKNEFISQKNQFFSPKISLQPKLILGHFALSLMLEAEYDVTNPAWHQTTFERKEPHLLKPFQQTCFTGLISIGYKPG